MFRKWLVALFAILSAFCLIPVLSDELPATDISQDQNQAEIVKIINQRIMQGFPDGSFKPGVSVTEDAFAKVLQRFLTVCPRGNDAGFESKGSQEISRIRAISLIVRCLVNKQEIEAISDPASILADFTDYQAVPAWALKYAASAANHGLLEAGEAIRPQASLTRSELAKLLAKAIEPGCSTRSTTYTSLVIDCRGLVAERSMSPAIFFESGDKLYPDPKNIPSQNYVDENGIVGYARQLEDSKRVGSAPLVIKAISMKSPGSEAAVISDDDKEAILKAEKAGHFLKKWNVVFLID